MFIYSGRVFFFQKKKSIAPKEIEYMSSIWFCFKSLLFLIIHSSNVFLVISDGIKICCTFSMCLMKQVTSFKHFFCMQHRKVSSQMRYSFSLQFKNRMKNVSRETRSEKSINVLIEIKISHLTYHSIIFQNDLLLYAIITLINFGDK